MENVSLNETMSTSSNGNFVRIRNALDSRSRWFTKFNGDPLQSNICGKIFIKSLSVFSRWAKLWKNALSRYVKEFFKIFLEQMPEKDDLQNLIVSFIYTVNHKKTWHFIFDYNFG